MFFFLMKSCRVHGTLGLGFRESTPTMDNRKATAGKHWHVTHSIDDDDDGDGDDDDGGGDDGDDDEDDGDDDAVD